MNYWVRRDLRFVVLLRLIPKFITFRLHCFTGAQRKEPGYLMWGGGWQNDTSIYGRRFLRAEKKDLLLGNLDENCLRLYGYELVSVRGILIQEII